MIFTSEKHTQPAGNRLGRNPAKGSPFPQRFRSVGQEHCVFTGSIGNENASVTGIYRVGAYTARKRILPIGITHANIVGEDHAINTTKHCMFADDDRRRADALSESLLGQKSSTIPFLDSHKAFSVDKDFFFLT